MTRLYVGNLPYSYNEDSIKELFSAYGEVSNVQVIMDRMTGRSKGFAFIEVSEDISNQVITEMNGKDVNGRNLVVSVARSPEERTERPRRDFRSNDRNGGNNRGYRN